MLVRTSDNIAFNFLVIGGQVALDHGSKPAHSSQVNELLLHFLLLLLLQFLALVLHYLLQRFALAFGASQLAHFCAALLHVSFFFFVFVFSFVPPYVVDSSPHGPENVIVVVIIIIVIAAALDLLHDVLLAGREVHPLELLAAAILLVLPFGGAASVGDAEEKRDEEDCELGHFAIDG